MISSTQGLINDRQILFILTNNHQLVEVELNTFSIIEKSDIRRDITIIKYFEDLPFLLLGGTYD